MIQTLNIALVGNPNSGKSSLFNALTGLKQKVGNFPGVTVDKKTGQTQISPQLNAVITDLPGTYSLYPKREDEWVTYQVLLGDASSKPDMVILVADASNLKRNLLFCSQILDLKVPIVVALTMTDLARKQKIKIDIDGLQRELGVQVVAVNPRKNKGISDLKKAIEALAHNKDHAIPPRNFIDHYQNNQTAIQQVRSIIPGISDYTAIQYLIYPEAHQFSGDIVQKIQDIATATKFNAVKTQAEEILQRYERIKLIMNQTVVEADPLQKSLLNEKLDNILLHRTWGYVILFAVLFLLFQCVFWLSSYPMDGIEWSFRVLSGWLSDVLPQNAFTDLFINGIVAGLSGIVVFVPQIMILFGLVTLLEDTGYMARISFLTDKIMRKVGLNGKSVMPMISAYACAVPAIMSARSIENKKERLLTIMVTPLMSCSARLPVYTMLISLVIPSKTLFGFMSLQGLVMMGLYLFSTLMALVVAWVMKWFIKTKERSYFILELPMYREPRWKTIITTMISKAKIFVTEAGKVIMIISVILWALSAYGPKDDMHHVAVTYDQQIQANPAQAEELEKEKNAELLANSYAGRIGKAIEPAIEPLGYDWKIGIALITSFAAREVFVGTMATLYSVGEDGDVEMTLREKMVAARRSDGMPLYTLATGLSLMVFYMLAMQCMSTIAIVRRETRSWKWPLIQLLYMTVLAYVMSWITYQIFQ